MATTHTGRLINRFALHDRLIIRAQLDSGRIIDVRVAEQDREQAAAIRGNGIVPFIYRGGRAFFLAE